MTDTKTLANSERWTKLRTDFVNYLQGHPVATQNLFSELSQVLKAFFFNRTKSNEVAEDLTQVTLLKIHFARERYDVGLSLKTWIFTVANRCLIDHWRGLQTEESSFPDAQTEEDTLSQFTSDKMEPALRYELNKDLNRALDLLKPNDRTIVYLYAVEGFSMAEIAETLQMSEAAVKVRAHRAYVELRKLLSHHLVLALFILCLGGMP